MQFTKTDARTNPRLVGAAECISSRVVGARRVSHSALEQIIHILIMRYLTYLPTILTGQENI